MPANFINAELIAGEGVLIRVEHIIAAVQVPATYDKAEHVRVFVREGPEPLLVRGSYRHFIDGVAETEQ